MSEIQETKRVWFHNGIKLERINSPETPTTSSTPHRSSAGPRRRLLSIRSTPRVPPIPTPQPKMAELSRKVSIPRSVQDDGEDNVDIIGVDLHETFTRFLNFLRANLGFIVTLIVGLFGVVFDFIKLFNLVGWIRMVMVQRELEQLRSEVAILKELLLDVHYMISRRDNDEDDVEIL